MSPCHQILDLQLERPFRLVDDNTILQMIGQQWVQVASNAAIPSKLQPLLPSLFPEVAAAARRSDIAAMKHRRLACRTPGAPSSSASSFSSSAAHGTSPPHPSATAAVAVSLADSLLQAASALRSISSGSPESAGP